jgi:glycosyltransferase involved in cell wall biosynthesis
VVAPRRRGRAGGRTVLVVTHEASRTGAPKVALDLLDALQGGGWRTVAVLRWGGPLEADFTAAADRTLHEPFRHLRAVLLRRGWSRRVLVPRLERVAARLVLRRTRPDLVWANTVISAPYAVAAARRGVPSVVLSHEHPETVGRTSERSGLARLVHGPHARPPVLLGCAPMTAEVLREQLALPTGSVGVLHSPVDVDGTRGAAEAPSTTPPGGVVAVGLANESKGADVFAAAAQLAAARGMDVPWRWVGEVAMDLADGPAQFVGPRANAAAEIAAADVLVLPSRTDAFPLVVLEAMAIGTPVVAVDLPGPVEQLGGAGWLVPTEDPAAIVDAVAEVLADPAAAAERAAAARQRCVQHWDIARFRERVLALAASAASVRPVRVVHLLTRLSRNGGVQVVVRRLIAQLDPTQVETQVVTVKQRMEMDQLEQLHAEVHPLGLPTTEQSPLDRLRILTGMAAAVRRTRPDVVQVHSGISWIGALARLAAPRAAFLLEVHDAPGSGRHSAGTDRMEQAWPRLAGAHIVCHSRSVAQDVQDRWGVPAERVSLVQLAVDVDRFVPVAAPDRDEWRREHGVPDGSAVLIAVGRFAPSKRLDDAVRVLALLRRQGRAVTLVLVGDHGQRDEIEQLAEQLDCRDALVLPGFVDDLPLAIGSADVLLSCSEYEGFGLTIIEAMACAVPVVATAVGGVPDSVMDGVTGHLVEVGRPEQMAERVAEVLDAGAAPMGAAGRERAVQRFSFARFGEEFTDLYRTLAR